MAGFGESLVTTGPITGEVVYVGRGCDPAYQAGQPLEPYLVDPAGKIALIDRGSCTFVAKVKNAQDLGAIMVIVANNAPGAPIAMGGGDPVVMIPSVMVSQADGRPVQGELTRSPRRSPTAPAACPTATPTSTPASSPTSTGTASRTG